MNEGTTMWPICVLLVTFCCGLKELDRLLLLLAVPKVDAWPERKMQRSPTCGRCLENYEFEGLKSPCCSPFTVPD